MFMAILTLGVLMFVNLLHVSNASIHKNVDTRDLDLAQHANTNAHANARANANVNSVITAELKTFHRSQSKHKPQPKPKPIQVEAEVQLQMITQLKADAHVSETTVKPAPAIQQHVKFKANANAKEADADESRKALPSNKNIVIPNGESTPIQRMRPYVYNNSSSMRDPIQNPSNQSQKLPLTPLVEYMGVLLDAGRQYYPVQWIYNLIDYLHLLGFNLLHFRLTDDQAFNMRLDCRPELAQPTVGSNGLVYTPTELRALVQYAQSKNIVIMPEVNVPGHAGGFAGYMPNLVVPCAPFICSNGYGLPLNSSHPELMPILRDVMREVKDIFSTTPFFHLGGDELEMSRRCFTDLGLEMFDYNQFEVDLGKMLSDVGIEENQVVRWEMTGQDRQSKVETQVKGIDHYWYSRDYQDLVTTPPPRVFCSHGLYFDSNQQEDNVVVHEYTRTIVQSKRKPIAIIAGAFELGVQYWMDRNVPGRLLAVAMGASGAQYSNNSHFKTHYQKYCQMLDLPQAMCLKNGAPLRDERSYKKDWGEGWKKWKSSICDRLALTEAVSKMALPTARLSIHRKESNDIFWDNFFKEPDRTDAFGEPSDVVNSYKEVHLSKGLERIANHKVKHTGISLNLGENPSPRIQGNKIKHLTAIFDYLKILGFNTVQLRIMSNFDFALKLDKHSQVEYQVVSPYDMRSIKLLVDHAAALGLSVMPELSVIHRAGGLVNAAPIAACPQYFCEQGGSLTIDTRKGDIVPIASSILRELRTVFSSPFLHLGYDERNESMGCISEAGINPNFDHFEQKLMIMLEEDGIPLDKVLRWENEEQKSYKNRAGNITHFRVSMPSKESDTDFFLSTGLHLDDALSNLTDAWDIYEHVQEMTTYKPLGVIAPLLTLRDSILEYLNVRQRLLAVAIGLSVDGLGKPEFRQLFQELCEDTNNTHCEEFGVLRDVDAASKEMSNEAVVLRGNVCRSLLHNDTVARPREGVLVEVGTDTNAMAGKLYTYMDDFVQLGTVLVSQNIPKNMSKRTVMTSYANKTVTRLVKGTG